MCMEILSDFFLSYAMFFILEKSHDAAQNRCKKKRSSLNCNTKYCHLVISGSKKYSAPMKRAKTQNNNNLKKLNSRNKQNHR